MNVFDFDSEDAKNDGFGSLDKLKSALRRIYGNIKDYEFVFIYYFK